MPSLSTSEHIRRLAAEHGISEVEDEVDRFVTAISSLESDVPPEIQGDLRLIAKLGEIGVIDNEEMVRLVLSIHRGEN
ncbi:hypothetical protein [Agrobacterium pusense]|uniref:hypothetical protein n=1 Tax=Agrobacterium pusense TaxID=648995 RepID=UPI000D34A11C|nr:hypothetical protein [Agrobacterium pusense]PTV70195.1 hypothetical protein DBL06_25360 [Agrobacterium pusense]